MPDMARDSIKGLGTTESQGQPALSHFGLRSSVASSVALQTPSQGIVQLRAIHSRGSAECIEHHSNSLLDSDLPHHDLQGGGGFLDWLQQSTEAPSQQLHMRTHSHSLSQSQSITQRFSSSFAAGAGGNGVDHTTQVPPTHRSQSPKLEELTPHALPIGSSTEPPALPLMHAHNSTPLQPPPIPMPHSQAQPNAAPAPTPNQTVRPKIHLLNGSVTQLAQAMMASPPTLSKTALTPTHAGPVPQSGPTSASAEAYPVSIVGVIPAVAPRSQADQVASSYVADISATTLATTPHVGLGGASVQGSYPVLARGRSQALPRQLPQPAVNTPPSSALNTAGAGAAGAAGEVGALGPGSMGSFGSGSGSGGGGGDRRLQRTKSKNKLLTFLKSLRPKEKGHAPPPAKAVRGGLGASVSPPTSAPSLPSVPSVGPPRGLGSAGSSATHGSSSTVGAGVQGVGDGPSTVSSGDAPVPLVYTNFVGGRPLEGGASEEGGGAPVTHLHRGRSGVLSTIHSGNASNPPSSSSPTRPPSSNSDWDMLGGDSLSQAGLTLNTHQLNTDLPGDSSGQPMDMDVLRGRAHEAQSFGEDMERKGRSQPQAQVSASQTHVSTSQAQVSASGPGPSRQPSTDQPQAKGNSVGADGVSQRGEPSEPSPAPAPRHLGGNQGGDDGPATWPRLLQQQQQASRSRRGRVHDDDSAAGGEELAVVSRAPSSVLPSTSLARRIAAIQAQVNALTDEQLLNAGSESGAAPLIQSAHAPYHHMHHIVSDHSMPSSMTHGHASGSNTRLGKVGRFARASAPDNLPWLADDVTTQVASSRGGPTLSFIDEGVGGMHVAMQPAGQAHSREPMSANLPGGAHAHAGGNQVHAFMQPLTSLRSLGSMSRGGMGTLSGLLSGTHGPMSFLDELVVASELQLLQHASQVLSGEHSGPQTAPVFAGGDAGGVGTLTSPNSGKLAPLPPPPPQQGPSKPHFSITDALSRFTSGMRSPQPHPQPQRQPSPSLLHPQRHQHQHLNLPQQHQHQPQPQGTGAAGGAEYPGAPMTPQAGRVYVPFPYQPERPLNAPASSAAAAASADPAHALHLLQHSTSSHESVHAKGAGAAPAASTAAAAATSATHPVPLLPSAPGMLHGRGTVVTGADTTLPFTTTATAHNTSHSHERASVAAAHGTRGSVEILYQELYSSRTNQRQPKGPGTVPTVTPSGSQLPDFIAALEGPRALPSSAASGSASGSGDGGAPTNNPTQHEPGAPPHTRDPPASSGAAAAGYLLPARATSGMRGGGPPDTLRIQALTTSSTRRINDSMDNAGLSTEQSLPFMVVGGASTSSSFIGGTSMSASGSSVRRRHSNARSALGTTQVPPDPSPAYGRDRGAGEGGDAGGALMRRADSASRPFSPVGLPHSAGRLTSVSSLSGHVGWVPTSKFPHSPSAAPLHTHSLHSGHSSHSGPSLSPLEQLNALHESHHPQDLSTHRTALLNSGSGHLPVSSSSGQTGEGAPHSVHHHQSLSHPHHHPSALGLGGSRSRSLASSVDILSPGWGGEGGGGGGGVSHTLDPLLSLTVGSNAGARAPAYASRHSTLHTMMGIHAASCAVDTSTHNTTSPDLIHTPTTPGSTQQHQASPEALCTTIAGLLAAGLDARQLAQLQAALAGLLTPQGVGAAGGTAGTEAEAQGVLGAVAEAGGRIMVVDDSGAAVGVLTLPPTPGTGGEGAGVGVRGAVGVLGDEVVFQPLEKAGGGGGSLGGSRYSAWEVCLLMGGGIVAVFNLGLIAYVLLTMHHALSGGVEQQL